MASKKRNVVRTMAATLAAAAAFTLAGPAGTASAIDHVTCDPDAGFLKIWSHDGSGHDSVDCYANRGKTDFGGWWVDQISTGNNDVKYYDANGDVVKIPRNSNIKYSNVPKVAAIEIL
ncbi:MULTISPECIES: beta/gamma crystallin domain-containing protein [unclassified Streptomyces]|uniref:beta/gamma crystallin domain-containing protein n=1 Tax=unclassified Streptomyces TaxID=2593676 RepID=UPI0011E83E7E|nr:beta/gamma crystallin domain-containing protein [Streptomyces sp. sk2.1]TXS67396.1 oxidoreductase [Streptomyces sp. sk2.1]